MKYTAEQLKNHMEQGGAIVERYIGPSTSTWSPSGVLHRYPDGTETHDKPFKPPFMTASHLARHLHCRQDWSELELI